MIKMSWKQFDNFIDITVDQIRESNIKFDQICAIPRGGLIVGTCLSHKLNIPIIAGIHHYFTERTLIVDDICDSGETLTKYVNKLLDLYRGEDEKIFIAVLVQNMRSGVEPARFHGMRNPTNEWIKFPWEALDIEDTISLVKTREE